MISAGFDIFIESGAGDLSQISDSEYAASGAKIFNTANEIYENSDMILKVNSPTDNELSMIKENSSYISFFQTMKETTKVKIFKDKNITGFSMHLIPTAPHQKMSKTATGIIKVATRPEPMRLQ